MLHTFKIDSPFYKSGADVGKRRHNSVIFQARFNNRRGSNPDSAISIN